MLPVMADEFPTLQLNLKMMMPKNFLPISPHQRDNDEETKALGAWNTFISAHSLLLQKKKWNWGRFQKEQNEI